MSEEAIPAQPQPRRRSNSLPIPHIEISVYQGPGTNSRDSPTGSSITKDFIEIPDQPVSTLVTGINKRKMTIELFADILSCTQITEVPAEPFSQPRNDDAVSTGRRASEKKRRVKMADLRNLIETRMFSKSERTLEKIGMEPEPVSQCKPLENSV